MNNFNLSTFRPWAFLSFFWFTMIVFLGLTMRISFAFQIPLPTPIDFTRHAHSHTGFWAWAGPIFFGFILAYTIEEKKRSIVFEKILLLGIQILSFIAFLSFILSGYSRVSIIVATLMVVLWLGFTFYLFRSGKNYTTNSILNLLIRLGVFMLLASTLPTFFIPISIATGIGGEAAKTISIHFFLDSYSEGWLYTMSLVLYLYLVKEEFSFDVNTFSKIVLIVCVPVLLLVCLRSSMLLFPKTFQYFLLLGTIVWGIFQFVVSFVILRKTSAYRFIGILILIKAVMGILAGFPIFTPLIQSKMFSLLYLHLKLLGIVSGVIVIFVVKIFFLPINIYHFAKISILIGVSFTLLGMLLIAISSLPPSVISELLTPTSLWTLGQMFTVFAGLPVLVGGFLICKDLLYFSDSVSIGEK